MNKQSINLDDIKFLLSKIKVILLLLIENAKKITCEYIA